MAGLEPRPQPVLDVPSSTVPHIQPSVPEVSLIDDDRDLTEDYDKDQRSYPLSFNPYSSIPTASRSTSNPAYPLSSTSSLHRSSSSPGFMFPSTQTSGIKGMTSSVGMMTVRPSMQYASVPVGLPSGKPPIPQGAAPGGSLTDPTIRTSTAFQGQIRMMPLDSLPEYPKSSYPRTSNGFFPSQPGSNIPTGQLHEVRERFEPKNTIPALSDVGIPGFESVNHAQRTSPQGSVQCTNDSQPYKLRRNGYRSSESLGENVVCNLLAEQNRHLIHLQEQILQLLKTNRSTEPEEPRCCCKCHGSCKNSPSHQVSEGVQASPDSTMKAGITKKTEHEATQEKKLASVGVNTSFNWEELQKVMRRLEDVPEGSSLNSSKTSEKFDSEGSICEDLNVSATTQEKEEEKCTQSISCSTDINQEALQNLSHEVSQDEQNLPVSAENSSQTSVEGFYEQLKAQMMNLMSTAPPGAREQLGEILESLVPLKEQVALKDTTNKKQIQVEKRRRKGIQQQKNIDEVALATAKQLKKFGVNCLAREFSPEQQSLEFNSLAMKYLKDDQLAQLAKQGPGHRMAVRKIEAIKETRAPYEMSFASKKYLKKYGLLSGEASPISSPSISSLEEESSSEYDSDDPPSMEKKGLLFQAQGMKPPPPVIPRPSWPFQDVKPSAPTPTALASNRILDVEALKRQPKLL
ncbi:unnamed protein product [Darwinula stevensoni]|uniref:Uncharacterized protein n=1 Tax=Darwinula stevensoni TaxID=69355 RepID=A0A7R8X654_9CRUS|nr:unnamed protein product [Darwinula stevensoni]CAG0885375.1 unnamed protein product [Darwinula stevensoni]